MISLLIKGDMFVACAALRERGIFYHAMSQWFDHRWETRASCYPRHLSAVIAWFNEPDECVQGQGYPPGSLLHYSQSQPLKLDRVTAQRTATN